MEETRAKFSLRGRVALVTGASSGLGARFAQVLRKAGADVVIAARRADRLERLASELGVVAATADVTSPKDRGALLDLVVSRFGHIDILVNNAGACAIVPAEDEAIDDFRSVIEVNLVAQFAMAQLAGRLMLAVGSGSIVNIASVLGIVGVGQMPQASYSASKGGVVNMTRELAAQWARRGVRVNAIAPGWFPSDMTAGLFENDQSRAWLRRKVPMGRGGNDGELDGVLLLLASDAGSYITGQTIAVDGGFTAT